MSEDFEQQLRDELGRAVPEPPEDLGRAASARRISHRWRRARRGILAVGAATVAVAALVAVPVMLDEDPQTRSGVTVDDETPTDELTHDEEDYEYICPEATETGLLVPSRELPGGAVLARICPAGSTPWSEPIEPLRTGLDELVIQINAADPLPAGTACPADIGPGFTMTFQYDDRRTYGIRGSFGGCNTMVVGGEQRRGAPELVRLYAELLAAQRAGQQPPADPGIEPDCADAPGTERDDWRTILYADRRLDLAQATVCVFPVDGEVHQTDLTPEQVQLVNDDFAARATRTAPGDCRCPGPVVAIRGVDAWGDRYELVRWNDVPAFSYDALFWMPSEDVRVMLAGML